MLIDEELTDKVIGAAIEVHRALGPGLLESAYQECLFHELKLRGIACKKEVQLPLLYKGLALDCGYRLDLFVEERVILEIKAIDKLAPIHNAQLMTYMKLMNVRVGLLFNFNTPVLMQEGFKRIAI
jgi:GxxExxY protein